MERLLDHIWVILKTLSDSGDLRYTDLISLSTPKIGSAATSERTTAQCVKGGFVARPEKGVYRLTDKGRAMITALETPTT